MGKKNKLSSTEIANVLNRMVDGGGYNSVASDTHVAVCSAMEIAKAYPLWDYYRKPENYNYGDTNS